MIGGNKTNKKKYIYKDMLQLICDATLPESTTRVFYLKKEELRTRVFEKKKDISRRKTYITGD